MPIRTFYVVGNLKMNMLSREEAAQYLAVFDREAQSKEYANVLGIVCPSFVYISQFDSLPSVVKKGAQDVFWEKSGAYTGEISPAMLKDQGVEYVLIGHSERRIYGGETNEQIREKTIAALKHHLTPIVCIGETDAERRNEKTDVAIAKQVESVFSGLSKAQAEKIILAYEPRWAIGTDKTPTTAEILQVRVLLRKMLTESFDVQTAERIAVLYGGSVKSGFLPTVSWEAQMDGVLVGRESLFPYELLKMMTMFQEEADRQKGT